MRTCVQIHGCHVTRAGCGPESRYRVRVYNMMRAMCGPACAAPECANKAKENIVAVHLGETVGVYCKVTTTNEIRFLDNSWKLKAYVSRALFLVTSALFIC